MYLLRQNKQFFLLIGILILICCIFADNTFAQPQPKLSIGLPNTANKEDTSLAFQILALITILSLAPAIAIMMTSFTRLIIVFHFLRMALGTQTAPANQIIIGLSLFLTFFIMEPAFNEINEKSIQPYLNDTITQKEALDNAIVPIRKFMLKETKEQDMLLFVKLAKINKPSTVEELPTYILIPSFILSEIKIAFQIGFLLYLPLLLIDLIVAVILMSMGMMMLPPAMISLPFKILLFVLVDGWYLIIKSVVSSF